MGLEKKNYTLIDIFTIPFRWAKVESIIIVALKLIEALMPTAKVLITALFIDYALEIFNKTKQISDIIVPVCLLVMIVAWGWFSNQILKLAGTKIENKLRVNYKSAILEKIATLKYNFIEDQDSWDLISRIMKQPEKQCKEAYIDTLDMLSMIIKVSGILLILINKVWWSVLLILCIALPLFIIALRGGKETYDSNRALQKYVRKYEYLGEVLSGRDTVDERALFGYSNEVNKKWHNEYEIARKENLKVRAKWFIKSKLGSIISVTLSIFIIAVLISPVKNGNLSVGLFISIVTSLMQLIEILAWTLPTYGDKLAKNKEYLIDLGKLSAMESNKNAIVKPLKSNLDIKSIEFKNVSFKYPKMNNYILKNMSFKIEEGKHYAFVGTNGAGKTTITKLMTGLYEDFEGEILINNKSIREYKKEELKAIYSVVYQDYAKYQISLKDNIAIGNINKIDNVDEIIESLNIIGLSEKVEELPNGIDSNLGKINDDGIDLSGGQWQKIAMARAIVNPAAIRILDEPTAALDPISESNMYNRFEKISKGKTTIFISHRLGSTKLADEIFVLDDGHVIEKGNYDELIKLGGVYANMYESQRSWYI